ncbi:MAG: tetratricopeptide repeat protein [Bacteroidales bacterium]
MKKVHLILLMAFAVTVAFTASGCSGLKKMRKKADTVQYTTNPNPLEVHGGVVAVDVAVNYPKRYFAKKVTLDATPVLKYSAGSKDLQKFAAQGQKVRGNNKVIVKKTGGTVNYSDKFAYTPDMQASELFAQIVGSKKKKSLEFPQVKLADGIIATSQLLSVAPKPVIGKDTYKRITEDAIEGQIMYQINRAEVRKSELQGESIQKLKEEMAAAKANERVEIKGAQVLAYASPDGAFDFNANLSDKRKGTAQSVFVKELSAAKIAENSGDDFLQLLNTPEDWEGFKTLMEQSSIKDKELILRVLSMYSDPEVREREIKNLSAAFTEIKDQILPQLRRSRLRLNLNIIGLSDDEIREISKTNPSALKIEEILYAATLTQDLKEKAAIYEAAVKSYPNDWRTKNNLGAIYLQSGRVADAESLFAAARQLKDDAAVQNNLGAVAMVKGDFAKAEELYNAAAGAGAEVNYNKGMLNVSKGKYSEAITLFGNEADVNAALAKLLAKDNNGALTILNSIQNPSPLAYYLKAVVGARTANADLVYTNLREASKDAALKARAKSDFEFIKYANDATFKSIVQ